MASNSNPWTERETNILRLMMEDGRPMKDIMDKIGQKSKASILGKLHSMGLPPPEPEGKERKCMNFSECGKTFRSQFAGLCPSCRNRPSPTIFELPAHLL